ncbi:MAG: hypothetical protein CVU57_11490 [Deltaproteobacteria bacterium HGW-Deltaproteobacteria-15]|nr:MAG: hypothetical protein CVU57_11490 [Deltaproteobacteria bacterium HGW-Deltaproteobacteria-15]
MDEGRPLRWDEGGKRTESAMGAMTSVFFLLRDLPPPAEIGLSFWQHMASADSRDAGSMAGRRHSKMARSIQA